MDRMMIYLYFTDGIWLHRNLVIFQKIWSIMSLSSPFFEPIIKVLNLISCVYKLLMMKEEPILNNCQVC